MFEGLCDRRNQNPFSDRAVSHGDYPRSFGHTFTTTTLRALLF